MSSEPFDFANEPRFSPGVPLKLTGQFLDMGMIPYEEMTPTVNGYLFHNDMADYHATPEDYENPTSDFSSVLSEPPTEMDLDYEINPYGESGVVMELDETIDPDAYHDRIEEVLCPKSPAVLAAIFPGYDDVSSVSEPDGNGAEDFAYEDVLSDDDDDCMSLSEVDESGPLEKFFKLKVDAAVSVFENLPYEVLSRIACLLPSDSDLACLILTCHTFARQLQPENSGIWKDRFLQKYDHPIVDGPYEFRIAYQLRAMTLPRFGDIGFEIRDKAKVLLTILKDMVLETYNKSQPWHPSPRTSLNMVAFADAMKSDWMVHFLSTRLFARNQMRPFGREPYNKLFDTLQVVFSYLVLNRSAMAFQVGSDKSDYDITKVYNWDKPFALLYERLPDKEPEKTPPPSSLFPNLQPAVRPPTPIFKVDMNSLLNIRNFWHRHLTEARFMGGEETFVNAAAELADLGIVPRGWNGPLQEPSQLQTKWYGLYSCVYPWPKYRKYLQDKESEAEVWDSVDPLHLDISSGHAPTTAWPEIFSRIPALAKTLTQASNSPTTTYLRGLAPFQPTSHLKSPTSHPQHTLPFSRHPYTSLRLRGLIHPIAPQAGIPGWQRVVFALYKPSLRYLNNVFDYSTEWFGEAFEQTLSQLTNAAGGPMSLEEMQTHYAERLAGLLGELKGPASMTRERITEMEDRYRDPAALRWGDVDHTYVYEGVVVPGGRVMMGRWWRLGAEGCKMGDGDEYCVGEGVWERERGPFVFWGA